MTYTEDYVRIVVGDAEDGYRININGFQGNASDAMTIADGGQFSVDYDAGLGGFWYGDVFSVGINASPASNLFWCDPLSCRPYLIYTEIRLLCFVFNPPPVGNGETNR